MAGFFEENEEQSEVQSLEIDTQSPFQLELEKVLMTEMGISQLKDLRQMLVEGIAGSPVNVSNLVESSVSLAHKQGQLVVIDILLNSKNVVS